MGNEFVDCSGYDTGGYFYGYNLPLQYAQNFYMAILYFDILIVYKTQG